MPMNYNFNRTIPSFVFCLHELTAKLLLMCFAFTIVIRFFVPGIVCYVDSEGKFADSEVNHICEHKQTFTLPGQQGERVLNPAVVHSIREDKILYHSYYKFVPLVLFFQANLFHIPFWAWSWWRRRTYVREVMQDREIINSSFRYLLFHSLNLANVFFNIAMIERYLGKLTLARGLDVVNLLLQDYGNRSDPLVAVFPVLTECNFMLQPGRDYQIHSTLCVLSHNSLIEKMYVLLWFWMRLLSTLTWIDFYVDGLHFMMLLLVHVTILSIRTIIDLVLILKEVIQAIRNKFLPIRTHRE